ncbi:MAG: sigma-70 family RNA polymerase sigma factor [Legionellales bacterium]|nr:sigma-70 family RNA polymerase sigma factor [Legionellales bacterium]
MTSRQLEQQIICNVLQGDHQSFNLLITKYNTRIRILAQQFMSNPAAVDDVCQDVFLNGFRHLAQFQGRCQFYTWLHRIALNVIWQHLKLDQRFIPSTIDDNQFNGAMLPDALLTCETPEHLAITDELKLALMLAIETLPIDLRQSVLLREIEGMSYQQIAQTMQCPVGTVRSRIFRARHWVEQHISAYL